MDDIVPKEVPFIIYMQSNIHKGIQIENPSVVMSFYERLALAAH